MRAAQPLGVGKTLPPSLCHSISRCSPSSFPCKFISLAPFKRWQCSPVLTSTRAAAAQLNFSSPATIPAMSSGLNGDGANFSHPPTPSLVVFSGGTAFNGVVEELKKFTTKVAHVLPVSDNGGSTAEIVRVLGGPAVGDIRSRCLRLSDESTTEALAVKNLLGHRLSLSEADAKAEWCDILEELHNGEIIRGQNEISHPMVTANDQGVASHVITKLKYASPALAAPIKRIFYMSSEGTSFYEVFPRVNSAVVDQLDQVNAVVYGMGSLFTSICPSLVLRGVGEAIAQKTCPKVLIVNGTHDRETSGMSALDFVQCICDALNRKYGASPQHVLQNQPSQYVNAVLVPQGGDITVDQEKLQLFGIKRVIEVDSIIDDTVGVIFDPRALIAALRDIVYSELDKLHQS